MEHLPASHETHFDDPDVVAVFFGHELVEHLAQTIPRDAKVLTIGSGTADFAKTISLVRSDIDHINIDSDYSDPAVLKEAQTNAPISIEFLDRTIDQLGDEFSENSFDVIYFYDKPTPGPDSSPQKVHSIATTLLPFATRNGVLQMAPVVKKVGELGIYDKNKQVLTIAKDKPPRQSHEDKSSNDNSARFLKVAATLGLAATIATRVIARSATRRH